MKDQITLFDEVENEWEKEWKDMPEYVSENKKPVQQIIVSFATHADVVEFGKRLGFKPTPNTKSTWFPPRAWDTGTVWVNEDWDNDEK